MGIRQVKTPQSSLLFTKIQPILLNKCSLDYCRPLVNFHSFEGVDFEGFFIPLDYCIPLVNFEVFFLLFSLIL